MTATRHPAEALILAITETGCTKEQAILMVISALVDAGIPIQQAMDSVLGPGTYQEIADSTWELLQPA